MQEMVTKLNKEQYNSDGSQDKIWPREGLEVMLDYCSNPLNREGAGGDGRAHTSHRPQCWQLPLSQLNSDPTASFFWLHVWTHSRQGFASADMET